MRTGQLDALTGLRGLAAYSVLVAHLLVGVAGPQSTRLSYFGMSTFFVLSGFIITYNYGELVRTRAGLRQFLVARVARLLPLYIVVTTAFWIATGPFDPFTLLANFSLTQSWFNAPLVFGPGWSVSSECFYCAFVPLAAVLPRIRRTGLALVAFCVLAPIVMLGVLQALRPAVAAVDWYPWLTYYSPYARLSEFVTGALAARVYLSGRILRLDRSSPRWQCCGALRSLPLAACRVIIRLAAAEFLLRPGARSCYSALLLRRQLHVPGPVLATGCLCW